MQYLISYNGRQNQLEVEIRSEVFSSMSDACLSDFRCWLFDIRCALCVVRRASCVVRCAFIVILIL